MAIGRCSLNPEPKTPRRLKRSNHQILFLLGFSSKLTPRQISSFPQRFWKARERQGMALPGRTGQGMVLWILVRAAFGKGMLGARSLSDGTSTTAGRSSTWDSPPCSGHALNASVPTFALHPIAAESICSPLSEGPRFHLVQLCCE